MNLDQFSLYKLNKKTIRKPRQNNAYRDDWGKSVPDISLSRIALVTVDANQVAGALISSGIGSEATNVVAAPATVPAKTIKASLFSDASISPTKHSSPPKVNLKQKCELYPRKIQTFS
jgi:hypothetical protein